MTTYNQELTEKLKEAYLANPCRETIDILAAENGKSFRSIIAKLSSLGIYNKPQRLTKFGDTILKKPDMVQEIESWLGISVPTLQETGKLDLKVLYDRLKEDYVKDI